MLISIVMPAYNAESFLREAVSSVQRQTFSDWELLIINDGSTDGTAELMEELAREDLRHSGPEGTGARIRLFHPGANRGVAETRMYGVKQAAGEWIAFLDSDDAWEKEKLEKQVELAERTGAELMFTGSAFMDTQGRRKEFILNVPEEISYRELLKQNLISCSSVMVKKKWLLRFPMNSYGKKGKGRMHEDFASWIRMLRAGCSARGVNEPLLIYRVRSGSVSGDKRKAAMMTWRVYRSVGLSLPSSVYYFLCYVVRSLLKWRKI